MDTVVWPASPSLLYSTASSILIGRPQCRIVVNGVADLRLPRCLSRRSLPVIRILIVLIAYALRPTPGQWEAEVTAGWEGPDGSSCSTDDIMGIRIGITGPEYEYIDLAANRHDWYYRLGRRLRLSRKHRKVADSWYRDRCIEITDAALIGWRAYAARGRARVRYYVLRAVGGFAWRAGGAGN